MGLHTSRAGAVPPLRFERVLSTCCCDRQTQPPNSPATSTWRLAALAHVRFAGDTVRAVHWLGDATVLCPKLLSFFAYTGEAELQTSVWCRMCATSDGGAGDTSGLHERRRP